MRLNQGKYGRERILSRPSIELMTTDHLTTAQQAAARWWLGGHHGGGFGVSVITRRDDVASSPGRFGWDGAYGTSWASAPKEDLSAILMTQCLAGSYAPGMGLDVWTSVYQAMDD